MKPFSYLILATAILFAPSLCMTGCGPQTPIGTFGYTYTDPPPDMTVVPRLSVDAMGVITDRLMDSQACVWLYNKACEKRCFPVEPMWSGCSAGPRWFWYTRQGLTAQFKWGRLTTWQDPNCRGENTYTMVDLTFVTEDMRPADMHDCKYESSSFSLILKDRNWYTAVPSDLLPATTADLPQKPAP